MVSLEDFQNFKIALKEHGGGVVTIDGTSMLPLCKPGDQLPIELAHSQDELKQFDVIVFWQKDSYICHYVWRKNRFFNDSDQDPTFISRPLNPIARYDRPIKFSQVVGRVKGIKIPVGLKIKILLITWFSDWLKRTH